jgi:hypothetical protein
MAKGLKKKKHVRPKAARRSGSRAFGLIMAAVVVLFVALIVLTKESGNQAGAQGGPDIGQHWHAALGINVCGQWKANTPQYESAKGVHSHGDGFIHMHPYSRAGANENATVGLFLSQAQETVTSDSIKLLDGTSLKNGDECANLDKKPGKIRWTVNGEEKKGNPARYVPNDRDIIALAFLPAGEEIGVPPIAGSNPSDIGGEAPVTTPTTPPASTTESTEAPATTATTK